MSGARRVIPGALAAAAVLLGSIACGAAADPVGEFSQSPAGEEPVAIAPGADGNLWFADRGCESGGDCFVGRLTLPTRVDRFMRGLQAEPDAIAPGPDGDVWFVDGTAIARIAPTGMISEYSRGLEGGDYAPLQLTPGPDGNEWFIDGTGSGCCQAAHANIGRITHQGKISEFFPGLFSVPESIAPGADGNLWFTDGGNTPAVGRITTAGKITEYSFGLNPGSAPGSIAPGPDGNLWFADDGTTTAIGKITPSGQITEYSAGLNPGSVPDSIAPGPDGNVWFTDNGSTPAVGRITATGQIAEYSNGLAGGGTAPDGTPLAPELLTIAPGPDGNMWFTVGPCGDHLDSDCLIERIGVGPAATEPARLTISAAAGQLRGEYTVTGPALVTLKLVRLVGRHRIAAGTATRFGWPGLNGFVIRRRLKPGSYQLIVTPTRGAPAERTRFRIGR